MNAKFEWFGFSVARKHVYFYAILAATTLAANSVKDSLIGPTDGELARIQFAQLEETIADAAAEITPLR
jgi:hypothetical protein